MKRLFKGILKAVGIFFLAIIALAIILPDNGSDGKNEQASTHTELQTSQLAAPEAGTRALPEAEQAEPAGETAGETAGESGNDPEAAVGEGLAPPACEGEDLTETQTEAPAEPETEPPTERQTEPPTQPPTERPTTHYVLNTGTHKFHYPTCGSCGDIKEKNRQDYYGYREDLIEQGYEPCKRCKP